MKIPNSKAIVYVSSEHSFQGLKPWILRGFVKIWKFLWLPPTVDERLMYLSTQLQSREVLVTTSNDLRDHNSLQVLPCTELRERKPKDYVTFPYLEEEMFKLKKNRREVATDMLDGRTIERKI